MRGSSENVNSRLIQSSAKTELTCKNCKAETNAGRGRRCVFSKLYLEINESSQVSKM